MTTEPTNREMAAVARRAAEIIQERGKATGTAEDARGRVCALGALGVAQDDLARCARNPCQPSVPVLIAWQCQVPGRDSLVAWSDLPTTTAADIARVFLQVADDLEVAP